MEDTFVLRIQLGNNGMQTAEDVAGALRATADHLATKWVAGAYGYVHDTNGNNVGEWEVQ